MHTAFRTAAIAMTFLATAQSAQAQALFKRLTERAERQVEESVRETRADKDRTMRIAIRDTIGETAAAPAAEAAPAAPPPAGGAATAARAPAPAPSARTPRYVSDLRAPAEAEAQRVQYNKFGEASCNDCEGGIDFDGRPKFAYDQFSGQYNERAKRAGSWPVGHVHRWKGKAASGTLTVTAEEQVDGFRCRRLEYRLVKGTASATRPSLICWGLANRSSEVENWHEVY